jgi:hypothetical protein
MTEFIEASYSDLLRSTLFLHHVKPSSRTKIVVGIEKAKPFDQCVVFHLNDKGTPDDSDEICVLASEYILEHPYWKGKVNDTGN